VIRLTAGIVALALSGASHAAPSAGEARAIYEELGRPINQAPQWNRKPLYERHEAVEQADQLIARAERAFGSSPIGEGAACRNAAISRKFFVINLNDLTLLLEGRPLLSPHALYAPMTVSVRFGEQLAACHSYIDRLKK
jgi:hypothetical protein